MAESGVNRKMAMVCMCACKCVCIHVNVCSSTEAHKCIFSHIIEAMLLYVHNIEQ